MANTSCPHCRRAVDVPPELAGQLVTCPHTGCGRDFQMPGSQPAPQFAPSSSRREPPSRKSSSDGNVAMLLAGILVCNVILLGMLAAWEVRYQVFRANMTSALEDLKQRTNR